MSFELLKEFTLKAVLAYARTRQPRNYLGVTLFPVRTENALSFQYWKDQNRLPVMASIQAYGAEAQIASREGATKITGEIPPIKRKIPLDERELLALKREGAGDIDLVRGQLYNDIDNMVDSVQARIEKMRMDAVAYGSLILNENGVVMNVDYGVPATNKETLANENVAGGYWNYANAEPVTKIQEWVNAVVAACGVRPIRALTSNTVLAYMLKNAQIRTMIYGDQGGSRAVSLNQINELMATLDLPIIATYDLQVRAQAEDGTYSTIRFFPATRFVLLPPASCGETLMGPTAEALVDDEVDAREVAGIYARVDAVKEPPGIWTKAAATSIPTFPFADGIFIGIVLAE
jgi:hypothetical protein